MLERLFERITYLFDPIHHFWEHERMHRRFALLVVFAFFIGLFSIELCRRGWLPPELARLVPTNHFYAVNLAFSLVLVLEVISLIFTLPCSFSRSVGKQFEILSLILLRDAFKELSAFPEPITIGSDLTVLYPLFGYGFGALLVFVLLGVYYRLQPVKRRDDEELPYDLFRFVAAKKGIALLILGAFFMMGGMSLYRVVMGFPHEEFFPVFYTLLIFTDIAVVLLAQCFRPSFQAVFRNSGYALSTLFIRLALAAQPLYDVLIGLAAIIFAILLTLAWTRVFTVGVKRIR